MLNRDTASRLAISSPLEAHKSHAIIFHTCGVDVGFDNPIFAVSQLMASISPIVESVSIPLTCRYVHLKRVRRVDSDMCMAFSACEPCNWSVCLYDKSS